MASLRGLSLRSLNLKVSHARTYRLLDALTRNAKGAEAEASVVTN